MPIRSFICCLVITFSWPVSIPAQDPAYTTLQHSRPDSIRKKLDGRLFVMRFESVETPCVCIDSADHQNATPARRRINSNNRLRLSADNKIDSGTSCLNQYCARYMQLQMDEKLPEEGKLTGTLSFSYGYPAGNIAQLLGFAHRQADKGVSFFGSLLVNTGKFEMYRDFDKYRISVRMDSGGPYETRDMVFGYLEIMTDPFSGMPVYSINFDRIHLHKGDHNNSIFLRFMSSSFQQETDYYARLLYDVIRHTGSEDIRKKAFALWTKNFYTNPRCPSCHFIYKKAMELHSPGAEGSTGPHLP